MSGLPEVAGAAALLLMPDPFTFPTDPLLRELSARAPGVPILGGLASGRTLDGDGALFCDEEVLEAGAVGLRLDDVDMIPLVSQGAAPIGPEMTITAAEGSRDLTSWPADPRSTKLRDVVGELRLSASAPSSPWAFCVGIVVDGRQARLPARATSSCGALLGADPDARAPVAVETPSSRPGQVVRLHARDAALGRPGPASRRSTAARRGVRRPPAGRRARVHVQRPRARRCSACPTTTRSSLRRAGWAAPAAGFFAAGEIGPVGGPSPTCTRFTATLGIFPS